MPKIKIQCVLCRTHIRNPNYKYRISSLSPDSTYWIQQRQRPSEFNSGDFSCAKCRLKVKNGTRVKVEKSWVFPQAGSNNHREADQLTSSPAVSTSDGEPNEDVSNMASVPLSEEIVLSSSSAEMQMNMSEGISISCSDSNEISSEAYNNNCGDEISLENHNDFSTTDDVNSEATSVNCSDSNNINSEVNSEQSAVSKSSTTSTSGSTSSTSSRTKNKVLHIPNLKNVTKSERRCFVCGSSRGRLRVKPQARMDFWLRTGIYIPIGNRTCVDHLQDGCFKESDIGRIRVKETAKMTPEAISTWFRLLTSEAKKSRRIMDFEPSSSFTNDDYELLLGVSRVNFDKIMESVNGTIKKSANRTTRNAVAMFLIKLRLNLSQKVIALLFGIKNQSVVSSTLDAVLTALEETFIPKYSGHGHISREDLLNNHMRTYFRNVLGVAPSELVVIMDGTYLYTEKPSDHVLQKRTFSLYKHLNLFKPMMVVTPSGYIIVADGLYFADNNNTDAKILKAMLDSSGPLRETLRENDVLLLDRGFRDGIATAENLGLKTYMPSLLKKGQAQFSTEEANSSRQVSMLRFIVEQVNGRIKLRFKFFDHRIPVSYFPKLGRMFQAAVALTNAFSPPLFTENEIHEELATKVHEKMNKPNLLRQEVEEKGLSRKKTVWEVANEDSVLEFPSLTLGEIRLITLGWYQISQGDLYNRQTLAEGNGYQYMYYKERPGLVHMKLRSRFTKNKTHNVFVEFEEHGKGPEAITQYYCMCKNGSRTLGCCSHVTAVIRYLGHDRYEPTSPHKDLGHFFLDAAESLVEEDSDSDSEEED